MKCIECRISDIKLHHITQNEHGFNSVDDFIGLYFPDFIAKREWSLRWILAVVINIVCLLYIKFVVFQKYQRKVTNYFYDRIASKMYYRIVYILFTKVFQKNNNENVIQFQLKYITLANRGSFHFCQLVHTHNYNL